MGQRAYTYDGAEVGGGGLFNAVDMEMADDSPRVR